MDTDLEARLVELEIRYSHLEHLTEQLSDLVRAQADQIELLRQGLRTMRGELDALGDGPTPHERPPHY
ncbi:MAG: SlyX family protein [bacterium]